MINNEQMIEVTFLSNVRASYKAELFRNLRSGRVRELYVARAETGRHSDFYMDEDPELQSPRFLSSRSIEQRNRFGTLLGLLKYRRLLEDTVILGGWDLIEYWFVRFILRPHHLLMVLESGIESKRRGVSAFLKRRFLRKVDCVLAAGQHHSELLRSLRYTGRVVKTGGVGLHRWWKAPREVKESDESTSGIRLLYVGRVVTAKNLGHLVREILSRSDYTLTVVGDGEDLKSLQRMGGKTNKISWMYHVPNHELSEVFAKHDVLVLPSIREPWGLVVEEAQHFGLPALVSDRVGCAPELVQRPGLGWVFASNDEESLRRVLDEMSSHSEMGRAKERLRSFDVGNRTVHQLQVWEKVIAEYRPAPSSASVLLVMPIPPPWTGQSVAAKQLLDYVKDRYGGVYRLLNTNKADLQSGRISLSRIGSILHLLVRVHQERRYASGLYLSLSQSLLGHLKDLLILQVFSLGRQVQITCQLHGSGIGALVFKKYPLLSRASRALLQRQSTRIVVLSKGLRWNFQGIVPSHRIIECANYPDPSLWVDPATIADRFRNKEVLRVLYLSNVMREKGVFTLIGAVRKLNAAGVTTGRIELDIVGAPEDDGVQRKIETLIDSRNDIRYHGPVSGDRRRVFYENAHLFALPTFYRYEGQPISILEAYSTGCAVLTTDQGGIPDIFGSPENGYLVEKESESAIAMSLRTAIDDLRSGHLETIGIRNRALVGTVFGPHVTLPCLSNIIVRGFPAKMAGCRHCEKDS